jgi:hypothetical protein
MLEKKIKVRQSGGANSYVVRFEVGDMSTVTLRIPMAFASHSLNEATGKIPTFRGGKCTAKVWWYETAASKPVTFATRVNLPYIEVDATPAGSKIGGNAVIALIDGDGIGMVGGIDPAKVVWTFHVWAMERTDDIDTFYHNPNREYMLRTVLGKHKDNNGMFYQWGRKDPFPQYTTQASPRFVRAEPVSSVCTESYVVEHPTVFFTGGTSWLNVPVLGGRWKEGVKVAHADPCPTGWRVPSDGEKNRWDRIGLQPGSLNSSDGSYNSTSYGFWLASRDGESTYPYWIESGFDVNKLVTNSSANGYSVRCIKDIKLVN